jgi:hypothetical protein
MDPQVTLCQLLEALRQGHKEEAADAAESLAAWLRKDGYCPTVRVRAFGTVGDSLYQVLHHNRGASACPNDTNGDGDCGQCARLPGGCINTTPTP